MHIRTLLLSAGLAAAACILAIATLLFAWPRPPDTTAPEVFAADGAALDYCSEDAFPDLDGSALRADAIPKAFTPGCGWTRWPMPILQQCAEPLARDAQDLRGLWLSTDPARRHVERIEQCGDRVVVTTSGIIHDFRTDGTLANGSRDIEPPSCMNTFVAIEWRGDTLSFRPFGAPFVAVTRRLLAEDTLEWRYLDRPAMRLERICRIRSEAG